MREIFRRMPSYRGEVHDHHPRFSQGSAAVCQEASGPVDLNAPDIIYTAEDEEAIANFHRDNGMSFLDMPSLRSNTESNLSGNDMALG